MTIKRFRFFILFPPLFILAISLPVSAQVAAPATQGDPADESLAAEAEALAAGATMFPVPQYNGDLFTRETLTGDWGGLRTALATENGIQFALDVNQYYQGIWDGGRARDSEYNGVVDYRIKFDTEAAGVFPGGFLDVHGETYWGNSVNGLTGAALPVNTHPVLSQPGGSGTYLSHVVYTQFFSEKFAVILGKLDTTTGDSNRFAHGVGDRRFMNLGFSFNPVTLRTVPYSTLGAGFLFLPAEGIFLTFSMIDSDGAINESGFDTIFNGNTTYAGELGIDTAFFEKPGRHLFGFAASTKEFDSVAQDPRVFAPALGIVPNVENGSWGFYYNFDQFLVTDPDDPSQGWGLFGRVGIADSDTNYVDHFLSGGLGGTGLIPGRDRDRFGVGYYYLEASDNRIGLLTDDSEQGVEVFYNMAVTPWFDLTADLQVIDGIGRFSDTAVVGGLRARLSF
ncbi:MAG: carbohydrate porin [Verrucomicrobiales bacterium]